MDFLYAIFGIVLVIGIALLLGRMDHAKNPVAYTLVWIGSIVLLLAMRFGFTKTWEFGLLILLVVLRWLERLPSWTIYTVLVLGIGLLLRHILCLIVDSLLDIGLEIERTNARLQLMENSLKDKLDDISSRLPGRE